MATEQLADTLTRALTADRPQTMEDRRNRDDQEWIVLNPGSHTVVGGDKYGPGDAVLVEKRHAERLTTRGRRGVAAARYLDEPEPDMRGNFPQVLGAGEYHADSKHAGKQRRDDDEDLMGEVEKGHPSDKDRGTVEPDWEAIRDNPGPITPTLAASTPPPNADPAPQSSSSGGSRKQGGGSSQGGKSGGSQGKQQGGGSQGGSGSSSGSSSGSATPPSTSVGDGGKSGA